MNKADLVNLVAARTELTKTDVSQVVDAAIETIIDSVVEGKKVSILGFGSFEPRERSARQGLNPKTGDKIKIPAKRVPAFTAGKLFKDPFHDEMGKALLQLHEATKSGNLDQLALAQAKLEGPKKTPIQSDHILGDEAQHFTSAFDSFLMKVPLAAKGKLKAYETEWVRLCLPKRVGKKTLVAVMPIENPEGLIEDFIPVPTGDDK